MPHEFVFPSGRYCRTFDEFAQGCQEEWEVAKGLLQESLSVSEPEAFRWIQKTAMDLRLSMSEVARGVIEHGPSLDAQGQPDSGE